MNETDDFVEQFWSLEGERTRLLAAEAASENLRDRRRLFRPQRLIAERRVGEALVEAGLTAAQASERLSGQVTPVVCQARIELAWADDEAFAVSCRKGHTARMIRAAAHLKQKEAAQRLWREQNSLSAWLEDLCAAPHPPWLQPHETVLEPFSKTRRVAVLHKAKQIRATLDSIIKSAPR